MAIHIRDPKTDALVREIARRRGIGMTEAVREVFEEALLRDEHASRSKADDLRARLKPLLETLDATPRTGLKADKQFFDDLWGEGDG